MALVGLVRVSTSKQETQRQHDDLDDICVKVFEEKVSGKLRIADRPGLQAALDYMRPGDMLTVQEADRLGRNLLEGLIVLNDLFQQGISVKILHGIAAGEHTERNFLLDLALALAEDRRRDIARKTRSGLDAARRQGRTGGRPRVVDADKRRAIIARHCEGQSLREISRGVGVSLAVVHGEVQAFKLRTTETTERPDPDLGKYDELLPSHAIEEELERVDAELTEVEFDGSVAQELSVRRQVRQVIEPGEVFRASDLTGRLALRGIDMPESKVDKILEYWAIRCQLLIVSPGVYRRPPDTDDAA